MSIKEKKILERNLGKNVTFTTAFTIILLALSLSWFADGLSGVLPKDYSAIIMLVVSLAIFVFFYLRLMGLNKKYAQEDNIDIKQQKSKPKRVLVLTLSQHFKLENIQNTKSIKMTNIGKKTRDANLSGWQMPLEAIWFHIEKLESIVVITSKESDKQYAEFIALVARCFDKAINISKVCIDINSLDDMKIGYHEVTQKVSEYSNSDVVYDITSGTSLSTMAGSYYTLNADRLIQYVDTNSYEIKMYNNIYVYDE